MQVPALSKVTGPYCSPVILISWVLIAQMPCRVMLPFVAGCQIQFTAAFLSADIQLSDISHMHRVKSPLPQHPLPSTVGIAMPHQQVLHTLRTLYPQRFSVLLDEGCKGHRLFLPCVEPFFVNPEVVLHRLSYLRVQLAKGNGLANRSSLHPTICLARFHMRYYPYNIPRGVINGRCTWRRSGDWHSSCQGLLRHLRGGDRRRRGWLAGIEGLVGDPAAFHRGFQSREGPFGTATLQLLVSCLRTEAPMQVLQLCRCAGGKEISMPLRLRSKLTLGREDTFLQVVWDVGTPNGLLTDALFCRGQLFVLDGCINAFPAVDLGLGSLGSSLPHSPNRQRRQLRDWRNRGRIDPCGAENMIRPQDRQVCIRTSKDRSRITIGQSAQLLQCSNSTPNINRKRNPLFIERGLLHVSRHWFRLLLFFLQVSILFFFCRG